MQYNYTNVYRGYLDIVRESMHDRWTFQTVGTFCCHIHNSPFTFSSGCMSNIKRGAQWLFAKYLPFAGRINPDYLHDIDYGGSNQWLSRVQLATRFPALCTRWHSFTMALYLITDDVTLSMISLWRRWCNNHLSVSVYVILVLSKILSDPQRRRVESEEFSVELELRMRCQDWWEFMKSCKAITQTIT